jgi:hypothetical protein
MFDTPQSAGLSSLGANVGYQCSATAMTPTPPKASVITIYKVENGFIAEVNYMAKRVYTDLETLLTDLKEHFSE